MNTNKNLYVITDNYEAVYESAPEFLSLTIEQFTETKRALPIDQRIDRAQGPVRPTRHYLACGGCAMDKMCETATYVCTSNGMLHGEEVIEAPEF